ncbi:DUF2306 domain-containing protein [Kitasatospora sp. NPDC059571]|uniref:DUF2306 domain-containing protein n=1 Tax=Kitasatospora sp. NPDC059571 TaxID=3346871 RepID=UPI0036AD791C
MPVAAGAARISELAAGGPGGPQDARFFAAPLPVVVHIVAASVYGVLGALRFAPGLRRRRPGWHRAAGRVLVPCGLAVALSGLWMTVSYPDGPGDGRVLAGLRLVFGSAMAVSLVLGTTAVLRRDIVRHRAWMARGYAIGLGAGTQVLTRLPRMLLVGRPGVAVRAVLMGAGWVINLAVVEWALRRRPAGGPARARGRRAGQPAGAGSSGTIGRLAGVIGAGRSSRPVR